MTHTSCSSAELEEGEVLAAGLDDIKLTVHPAAWRAGIRIGNDITQQWRIGVEVGRASKAQRQQAGSEGTCRAKDKGLDQRKAKAEMHAARVEAGDNPVENVLRALKQSSPQKTRFFESACAGELEPA